MFNNTKRDEKLTKVAQELLGLETLETRNSDSLDFKEQAVWSVREALEAAYRLGAEACQARLMGFDS